MKIKVFEAFAGYGSQALALERLQKNFRDFEFESVGISEIDKYAVQSYNALHPGVTNYGDISKINWEEVPDFDLFTYSFPCQDISSAGKQRGLTEDSGTRSSLLWECRRTIEAKRPKYLLMENVAALVSAKFKPMFDKWLLELSRYGYSNFAKVLNAKDFGVPQNRERIFVISILGDVSYFFPEPMKLTTRLKDILETKVSESYYLSDSKVQAMQAHCNKKQAEGCGFRFEPGKGDNIAKSITTKSGTRETDNYIMEDLDPKALAYTRDHTTGNVTDRHLKDIFNTIHTSTGSGNNTDCYIAEPILLDDFNQRIPKEQNVIGTVTTQFGNPAERHGWKIIEPNIIGASVNPLCHKLEFKGEQSIKKDIAPALRATDYKGPVVVWEENDKIYRQALEVMHNNECEEGDTILPFNKKINKSRICPTLTTRPEGLKTAILPVVKCNIEDNIEDIPFKEFDGPNADAKVKDFFKKLHIEYKGKHLKEGDGLYLENTENFFRGGLSGLSRSLKANMHDAGVVDHYRIRKLTPRECFRLMGLRDEDIDKLQTANISKSQQYKLAGNSIVVDVLYHIFRKMFIDTQNESQVLTLF